MVIPVGSTGDSPVPSGHWPDGTERAFAVETDVRKHSGALPVPSGGSPLGTGQWPVLPTGLSLELARWEAGAPRNARFLAGVLIPNAGIVTADFADFADGKQI